MANHPNRSTSLADIVSASAPGQPTLRDKIDALGNAALMFDDASLSDWDKRFAGSICERYVKYGDRLSLTPKQVTMIDKLYARVSGLPIL